LAIDGYLVVDKPSGMTSHDVVAAARRWVRPSRVGHTGTLDPAATGVLPLCIGSATRFVRFLTGGDKEYAGTMILGVTTDTYDVDGRETERRPLEGIDLDRIREAARRLTGTQMQIPPPWSAKKVEGRRAYELARSGAPPELPPCQVEIRRFEILGLEGPEIRFRVLCTTGTYVRALAHDLGRLLGCGAHLGSLRRERSGPFTSPQTFSLERLRAEAREGRIAEFIQPLESVDMGLPAAHLTPEGLRMAASGRPVPGAEATGDRPFLGGEMVRMISPQGLLAGIGEARPAALGGLQPRVVLPDRCGTPQGGPALHRGR
jgi:tRNA pseudouridine55 synthase